MTAWKVVESEKARRPRREREKERSSRRWRCWEVNLVIARRSGNGFFGSAVKGRRSVRMGQIARGMLPTSKSKRQIFAPVQIITTQHLIGEVGGPVHVCYNHCPIYRLPL